MSRKPTFLYQIYRNLTDSQKVTANSEMDGSNFDCNKCSKIIMRTEAECLMGGRKGEIPDICFEYGAVCKECFNPKITKLV